MQASSLHEDHAGKDACATKQAGCLCYAIVSARSSSSVPTFSKFMTHCRNFLHCFFPITSPPSAVNFTAISSSVMGSRGSPFGTSTRVEYDSPLLVVMVTRLG